MNEVRLNFINKSVDTNNSNIVFFQKNEAEGFDEIPVAWKVIGNCGLSDKHSFLYTYNFEVSSSDAYGNSTPPQIASDGSTFDMVEGQSGDMLQLSSERGLNSNGVEVKNSLSNKTINADCYKDGKLLARKTNVAPGQKATFKFLPKIYIGVVPQVEEGDVMTSAIISQINSEINLVGIKSADIVMTGGGSGRNASPLSFRLENINRD